MDNRHVDIAGIIVIHKIVTLLEVRATFARLLFIRDGLERSLSVEAVHNDEFFVQSSFVQYKFVRSCRLCATTRLHAHYKIIYLIAARSETRLTER